MGANIFTDSRSWDLWGPLFCLPHLLLQRRGGTWVNGEELVPFPSAVVTEQPCGDWKDTDLGAGGVRSCLA